MKETVEGFEAKTKVQNNASLGFEEAQEAPSSGVLAVKTH